MSKATYPLKLPASIKAAAARLAKEDGVSLNQWIATAVAAEDRRRGDRSRLLSAAGGERATPDELERIMQKVPDAPPKPEDAVPPDLAERLSRLK